MWAAGNVIAQTPGRISNYWDNIQERTLSGWHNNCHPFFYPLTLMQKKYGLSHAERGEPFQIQDFVRGIHLCQYFAPTPFRLLIPISNFGGVF
jgi:hypothetical protein